MDIVGQFRDIWKFKVTNTSNAVFKLHGKFSVAISLVFAVLVSAKQYFGDPIDCFVSKGSWGIKTSLDKYCWIIGTYTSKKGFSGNLNKMLGMGLVVAEEDRYNQKYYQWIVFVFILQAVVFYLPSYLWSIWEAGRLNMLCENLSLPLVTENWNSKRRTYILQYLLSNNHRVHVIYALRFFFCEILNFGIAILNIVVINLMFSGFWDGYAPAIAALINGDYDNWMKENSKFFPKIAKCDFHSTGPSGSVQTNDAMCILTLNILNEKLFAFLWVYLLVLTSISCFNLLFRLLTLISVRFRQHLVLSQLPATKYKQVKQALKKCRHVGDWFMLYQLSRNLNPIIFRDIMLEMSTIEQHKMFDSVEKFV